MESRHRKSALQEGLGLLNDTQPTATSTSPATSLAPVTTQSRALVAHNSDDAKEHKSSKQVKLDPRVPQLVTYPQVGQTFRSYKAAKEHMALAALMGDHPKTITVHHVHRHTVDFRCEQPNCPFLVQVTSDLLVRLSTNRCNLAKRFQNLSKIEAAFIQGFKHCYETPDWTPDHPVPPEILPSDSLLRRSFDDGRRYFLVAQRERLDFDTHPGIQRLLNNEPTNIWTSSMITDFIDRCGIYKPAPAPSASTEAFKATEPFKLPEVNFLADDLLINGNLHGHIRKVSVEQVARLISAIFPKDVLERGSGEERDETAEVWKVTQSIPHSAVCDAIDHEVQANIHQTRIAIQHVFGEASLPKDAETLEALGKVFSKRVKFTQQAPPKPKKQAGAGATGDNDDATSSSSSTAASSQLDTRAGDDVANATSHTA